MAPHKHLSLQSQGSQCLLQTSVDSRHTHGAHRYAGNTIHTHKNTKKKKKKGKCKFIRCSSSLQHLYWIPWVTSQKEEGEIMYLGLLLMDSEQPGPACSHWVADAAVLPVSGLHANVSPSSCSSACFQHCRLVVRSQLG